MRSEAPFYEMTLSPVERATINEAIELLTPHAEKNVSRWTCYFGIKQSADGDENEINDDGDYGEYDCCDEDACMEKSMAQLKEKYPDTLFGYRFYANDGDHESIQRCGQCSIPLHSSLTWIRQELEYHENNPALTRAELTKPYEAFDLVCLFEAMPSADERLNAFAIINRLEESLDQQEEFVSRVVSLATKVIDTLKP
jgi:hypothetical protein